MKTKIQKINIQTAALLMVALLGVMSPALAQNLGISATGVVPDASAGLDVNFTNKGVLIPRVALTGPTDAVTIPSPATSLLVYNTNTAAGLTPGYYYNAGTPASPNWVRLLNSGSPSDAWLTLGNAGTNSGLHFIGTTDNRSLRFKTNNVHRMVIDSIGNVGIGTTAPNRKLELVGDFNGLSFEAGTGSPNSGVIRFGDNSGWKLHFGRSRNSVGGPLNSGTSGVLMTIQDNGNVGIGTTSPLRRLHVSGVTPQIIADGFDGVIGSRCSHGSFFHLIGNYDGWDSLAVYIAGYNANNPIGNIYNSRAEKVHIGRPERLTVNLMNGNVGIGTTSPPTKLYVKGRGRAEYGWDIVCKDTTLPASANTNDLGTIINNLLSIYDCVYLKLPQNSTWTWNNTVIISSGKEISITGLGYQNGAANITVTVNVTNANTYTNPLCNGGNSSKDVAIVRILSGALTIQGIVLNANYCDTRPYGCSTDHKGLFCLLNANNFVNRVGHSRQLLVLSNMYIYSNEPVVNIGQWARADVFFGWTYIYRANPTCIASLYAVQYNSGWNFSGGKAIISTSHTTLGTGVSFHSDPHLEYQN